VCDRQERKMYLKTDSKLEGIYMYFILADMGKKAKMKNVPQAQQKNLVTL
jgi:hypothetical protein